MPVKFSVVARKNPADQTKAAKYYAQAVTDGEATTKELAKRISMISTVGYTDTFAVISALMEIIPDELKNGRTVRLGELGSLYIGNKSEGSVKADEVTASNIISARVGFRPGAEFRKLVKILDWEKQS